MKLFTQTLDLGRWPLMTLGFLIGLVCCTPLDAQEWSTPTELWQSKILPRDLAWYTTSDSDPTFNHSPRSWLFRMPQLQSCSVLGLDSDPDPTDEAEALPPAKEPESSRWQVLLGCDYPFLDIRRPGDPGGAGYYKMYSQVSLLDTPRYELWMGMQGVTPAGLDAEGAGTGPTIVSPSLGCACNLGDSACLQAFVSKNLRATSRWTESLGHPQFGVALQSNWPAGPDATSHGPSLFVEALSPIFAAAGQRSVRYLDMVPGIHWRLSENWWFTSGVLVPLVGPPLDTGQLQFTCSWRF